MIVNVEDLADNLKNVYPTMTVDVKFEEGFYEIKVIGENNSIHYFYPNDSAWFVKLYATHEAYVNHVIEEIHKSFILN